MPAEDREIDDAGPEDRGDAQDSLRAAEHRLERVGEEEDPRDLAEAERHDREIVAAKAKHGGTDQEPGDRGAEHDDRQGEPER